MDILRRSLAPISSQAWDEINEEARQILECDLTGRKFIDVEDPKGWDYAALPTGRLNVPGKQGSGVHFGIHDVLPLVETRVPFKLNIWELDNIARGAVDPNLDNLDEAARKIIAFEEEAIYYGLKSANIKGLKASSDHPHLKYPENPEEILKVVSEGISMLRKSSVEGPYSLVVNTEKWQQLSGIVHGYPLKKHLEALLEGNIIMSPNINESYLVSKRGGDFRLVLGQDYSIGYESHNNKEVELYFTESFTFQIIEPAAFIVMD
ncbi:MAG: bacteriocin family protein [Bacteroidales bacterium]|nr:bacteriocin family protein [Bacteroidales bacterium]